MINYLLSFATLFLFSSVGISQNLKIHDTRGNDITNTSITVTGSTGDSQTEAHAVILNISTVSKSSKSIKMRKRIVSVQDGTSNDFCWGSCYMSSIFESPEPIIVPSGDSTDGFSGHVQSNSVAGVNGLQNGNTVFRNFPRVYK